MDSPFWFDVMNLGLSIVKFEGSQIIIFQIKLCFLSLTGAQWLSGRVLDSRLKGRGFEPHWRHYVVVLEHDTFIVA